jgi:hypothetical protein
MAAMSDGPGVHYLYYETCEPVGITMDTELWRDEYGGAYVNAGDAISFTIDLLNDVRVSSSFEVVYGKIVFQQDIFKPAMDTVAVDIGISITICA